MNAILWDIPEMPASAETITEIVKRKADEFYKKHNRHASFIVIDQRYQARFIETFKKLETYTWFIPARNTFLGMQVVWADIESTTIDIKQISALDLKFLHPLTTEETLGLLELHTELTTNGLEIFHQCKPYLNRTDIKELRRKLVIYNTAIKDLIQTRAIIEDLVFAIEQQKETK